MNNIKRTANLLTHEETCRLVRIAQAGGPDALAARDRLIEANMGLVYLSIQREMRRTDPNQRLVEEWMSIAVMGLIRAISRFDPGRGFRFSTYASASMRRWLKNEKWQHGSAISLALNLQEEKKRKRPDIAEAIARVRRIGHAEYPLAAKPMPSTRDKEEEARLWAALDQLDPRLRDLLLLRVRGVTLEVAGESLGVTRERVRQMNHEALQVLAKLMDVDPAGVTALPKQNERARRPARFQMRGNRVKRRRGDDGRLLPDESSSQIEAHAALVPG